MNIYPPPIPSAADTSGESEENARHSSPVKEKNVSPPAIHQGVAAPSTSASISRGPDTLRITAPAIYAGTRAMNE